jgi:hypothetical protein
MNQYPRLFSIQDINSLSHGVIVDLRWVSVAVLENGRRDSIIVEEGPYSIIVRDVPESVINSIPWQGYARWDSLFIRVDEAVYTHFGWGNRTYYYVGYTSQEKRQCECGAKATSFPHFHSDWCPEYTELVLNKNEDKNE